METCRWPAGDLRVVVGLGDELQKVSFLLGGLSASSLLLIAGLTDGRAAAPVAPSPLDVLTLQNDIARTGPNVNQTILTPSHVNPNQFGKLFSQQLNGECEYPLDCRRPDGLCWVYQRYRRPYCGTGDIELEL